MNIRFKKDSSMGVVCTGQGERERALCKWLMHDIQQVDESVETALMYIHEAEKGNENYWGGNNFLVDFLVDKIVLLEQLYQNKYQYKLDEVEEVLLAWRQAYNRKRYPR